jgi:hypothetical protein
VQAHRGRGIEGWRDKGIVRQRDRKESEGQKGRKTERHRDKERGQRKRTKKEGEEKRDKERGTLGGGTQVWRKEGTEGHVDRDIEEQRDGETEGAILGFL